MTKDLTSLKISQRLKELGLPQDSKFYWIKEKVASEYQLIGMGIYEVAEQYGDISVSFEDETEDDASAYLATELLEWLPYSIEYEDVIYRLAIHKNKTDYHAFYGANVSLHTEFNSTLPNVLGELLIWCVEEGYVKL